MFNKDSSKLILYPKGKNETYYHIPDTVKCIGESAFEDCENLVKIILPDSIEEIGDYAFFECSKLKYVFTPKKKLRIGLKAFPKGVKIEYKATIN